MTDREMLEMAAKAAGIELTWYGDTDPWCYAEIAPGIKWNPLTDDGDALRLAVKLNITVMQPAPEDRGNVLALWPQGPGVSVPRSQDRFADTRRAIVRAASEIGRSMA